jgi:L-threonylcarbamoyladenylate synthase
MPDGYNRSMPPQIDRPTTVLSASDDSIRQAAAALRAGKLVVFPTETVYGLGADAENIAAVRAMFAAKERPADHPVIVHLADAALIEDFAAEVPPAAWQLAAAFWPGPMTLVLRKNSRVNDLVTGGLPTVGLRVPSHPVAQALLREFGGPIAAPSANRFGGVSATRAAHVAEELAGRVDLILDGGPCAVGLESSIIDVTSGLPAVLRPGAVTTEQIAAVLDTEISAPAGDAPRVSGSLPSHYAPRARVEILPPDALAPRAQELAAQGQKVALLGRHGQASDDPRVIVLEVSGDEADLGRSLYALLRQVDEWGCDVALASLPAETGLGAAIADRLRRAAGPRD